MTKNKNFVDNRTPEERAEKIESVTTSSRDFEEEVKDKIQSVIEKNSRGGFFDCVEGYIELEDCILKLLRQAETHFYAKGYLHGEKSGKKEERKCTKCNASFERHHHRHITKTGIYHTGCYSMLFVHKI